MTSNNPFHPEYEPPEWPEDATDVEMAAMEAGYRDYMEGKRKGTSLVGWLDPANLKAYRDGYDAARYDKEPER